jgi:hypothetical protein
MASLTLFGLLSVTAMMLCYAFEHRSTWFVLAFAGTCVLASAYGFLQGAWPFGVRHLVAGRAPKVDGGTLTDNRRSFRFLRYEKSRCRPASQGSSWRVLQIPEMAMQ